MKEEISTAVWNYVNISEKYPVTGYYYENDLFRHLEYRVFKLCVFMSLSDSCIKKNGIDHFINDFEEILWYDFLEKDEDGILSYNNEKASDAVRIAGYHPLAQPKDRVSCFSMLGLLLYNHVIYGEERKRFLDYMIIYPCCNKIERNYSDEDADKINEYLEITTSKREELRGAAEYREEFDKFARLYDYYKYINTMDVVEQREAGIKGYSKYKLEIDKGEEEK